MSSKNDGHPHWDKIILAIAFLIFLVWAMGRTEQNELEEKARRAKEGQQQHQQQEQTVPVKRARYDNRHTEAPMPRGVVVKTNNVLAASPALFEPVASDFVEKLEHPIKLGIGWPGRDEPIWTWSAEQIRAAFPPPEEKMPPTKEEKPKA